LWNLGNYWPILHLNCSVHHGETKVCSEDADEWFGKDRRAVG
jgi:hypothetical protein